MGTLSSEGKGRGSAVVALGRLIERAVEKIVAAIFAETAQHTADGIGIIIVAGPAVVDALAIAEQIDV